MGGLILPDDAEVRGVERVQSVVDAVRRGESMQAVTLNYQLARGPARDVTEILSGLSHFAVQSAKGAQACPQCIRDLMRTALNYDFGARPNATDDVRPTPALLDAYHHFVLNLVSANASQIEEALSAFARRAFLLSGDSREPVMTVIHSMLPEILDMYPQANDILARVVEEKYPHQVRAASDIVSFTRSVLDIAMYATSQKLRDAIIFTVVDKLMAIQALVPEDVYDDGTAKLSNEEEELSDCDELMSDAEDCQRHVTFVLPERKLSAAAEKMDLVLVEVLSYLEKSAEKHGSQFVNCSVMPIVSAYERFVVHRGGGRFVPFVLLHAINLAGRPTAESVSDRLQLSFFDNELRENVRLRYLEMSSGLVRRSRTVSPFYCLRWMFRVSQWLNRYVEPLMELSPATLLKQAQLGIHDAFYLTVRFLLRTIIARPDAFDVSQTGKKDMLSQMRLMRVLSCPLEPTAIVSEEVLGQFFSLAENLGDFDVRRLQEKSRLSRRITLSTNVSDVLEPSDLPLMNAAAEKSYRTADDQHAPVSRDSISLLSSTDSLQDTVNVPFGEDTPVPMIMSSS